MHPLTFSHRKIVFLILWKQTIHGIHCRSALPAFTYVSPLQAGPSLSAVHFKRMAYELGNLMVLGL